VWETVGMPSPNDEVGPFGLGIQTHIEFVFKLIARWKKYAKRGIDILRLPEGILEYTMDYNLVSIM
jgi:hypothetical protein